MAIQSTVLVARGSWWWSISTKTQIAQRLKRFPEKKKIVGSNPTLSMITTLLGGGKALS